MAATVFTSRVTRAGGFMVSEANNFRSRDEIVVLSGQVLLAGAVIGRVFSGGTGAAVAAAGNVGNGTMGAITVTNAPPGAYQLVITDAGANVGEFEVRNSSGAVIGQGTVAAAYSAGGLAFTLADGATDFAVGDVFNITVSGGTGKYKEYNPANTDGSQFVAGILWDDADATDGDVRAAAITSDAEVNQGELTWFSGASAGQIAAGVLGLRAIGIKPRPSVPA
jgi:hypothetical protein